VLWSFVVGEWHFFILQAGELPDFVGLDMNILPNVRDDLVRSIESGRLWLSNRTDETNKNEFGEPQYGLYAILPCYEQQNKARDLADPAQLLNGLRISAPTVNTSDARWSSTIGAVFASIRMSSIMDTTLSSLQRYPMQLDLYDLDPPVAEFSFITTGNPLKVDAATSEAMAVPLTFANHRYSLRCTPTHGFVDEGYTSTPLLIGLSAGGIVVLNVILLLLGAFLWGWQRARHRSHQLEEANMAKMHALLTLEQARTVSDTANKSKSDFLGFLCHELRNPLHAIGSMVDVSGRRPARDMQLCDVFPCSFSPFALSSCLYPVVHARE
jgi:hypothetical protein